MDLVWSQLASRHFSVHHLTLKPNVVYYLLEEDHLVVMAIFHSKQSPETMRSILKRFLENYRQ